MKQLTKLTLALVISLMTITTVNAQVKTSAATESILGYNQLGVAIQNNNLAEVKQLIESGVSPEEMQGLSTPLGVAVEYKRDEIFDYLISLGVDINKMYTVKIVASGVSFTNKTALLSAIDRLNVRMANILLDKGATTDYYSKTVDHNNDFVEDHTPLTKAVCMRQVDEKGWDEMVQRVADGTTNLSRIFTYSKLPNNQSPDISLLMRLVGDVDENEDKYRYRFNDLIKSIIDRGANINYVAEVSQQGDEAILKYGSASDIAAYKNAKKYIYSSALTMAASKGNGEILAYLLDKGAKMDRYSDGGASLFSLCSTASACRAMVERGVDINTCHPATGWPLLFSAISLETDLLEGMLEMGVDTSISINGATIADVLRGRAPKVRKKATAVFKKYGVEI